MRISLTIIFAVVAVYFLFHTFATRNKTISHLFFKNETVINKKENIKKYLLVKNLFGISQFIFLSLISFFLWIAYDSIKNYYFIFFFFDFFFCYIIQRKLNDIAKL